jgi:hypothetical protein
MTDFPAPPPVPEWATYIPGRTTKAKFVVHNTEGHEKSAISTACSMYQPSKDDMQLLHWDGRTWITVYSIPAGTTARSLPWRKK